MDKGTKVREAKETISRGIAIYSPMNRPATPQVLSFATIKWITFNKRPVTTLVAVFNVSLGNGTPVTGIKTVSLSNDQRDNLSFE